MPSSPIRRRPAPLTPQDLTRIFTQINGFVRSFDFELALKNLRTLESLAARQSDLDRVAERTRFTEQYLGLLDRMIESIKSGLLRGHPLKIEGLEGLSVRLVDANRRGFRAKLAQRGQVGERWSNMAYRQRWDLLRRIGLSGREWLTLGRLSHDLDAEKLAETCLVRAWVAEASMRPAISELLSNYRQQTASWVLYRGRFVTPEDKEHLARGLVRFRGKWVTTEDRRHLARNHVKQGGKWIPLTANQLRSRGYKKVEGRWLSPYEQVDRGRDFTNAWVVTTTHWQVKSNISQKYARRVANALETAYVAHRAYFGRQPTGRERMTMLAFRTYEDYRSYCKKVGKLAHINASGFSPSEPRTACAYDKHKNRDVMLRTLVHEATHLYFQLAYRTNVPSWVAEGMATYFEGYRERSGGRLTFHHKAAERLRLLKSALGSRQTFPLKELMGLRAGELLNTDATRALMFYAQCWGTFYFLQKTANPRYRAGFQKFFAGVRRGARPNLAKLLGVGLDRVDEDLRRFMLKQ